jgi:hypothetical protein
MFLQPDGIYDPFSDPARGCVQEVGEAARFLEAIIVDGHQTYLHFVMASFLVFFLFLVFRPASVRPGRVAVEGPVTGRWLTTWAKVLDEPWDAVLSVPTDSARGSFAV